MFPRKIRNFNAFLDGFSYFGRAVTATMPNLQLNTADFRGGGMDAPAQLDMGMQAMTAQLVLAEPAPEAMQRFGLVTRLVLRAAAQPEVDGEDARALVFTLGGRVTGHNYDQFGGGSDTNLALDMNVITYRLEENGVVLHEIDVQAGIRIINGVDQLASQRAAMGI